VATAHALCNFTLTLPFLKAIKMRKRGTAPLSLF